MPYPLIAAYRRVAQQASKENQIIIKPGAVRVSFGGYAGLRIQLTDAALLFFWDAMKERNLTAVVGRNVCLHEIKGTVSTVYVQASVRKHVFSSFAKCVTCCTVKMCSDEEGK
jgi:hypothetical protein